LAARKIRWSFPGPHRPPDPGKGATRICFEGWLMTMATTDIHLLHRLARLYGVEVGFRDYAGCFRQATPQALLAALQGLGAPVHCLADVTAGLRERTREQWERCCEPVVVGWHGAPLHLDLRLPAHAVTAAECSLELENGEVRRLFPDVADLPLLAARVVEGIRYEHRRLPLPPGLPRGYHRLQLYLGKHTAHVLIIVAPRFAHDLAGPDRIWGAFMPLYALHSRRSWGAGDYADLRDLLDWAGSLGGRLVGTLPLLAAFLDEPLVPSPYQPVSRLFWNEFYLDVGAVEEAGRSPGAQRLMESPEFRREIADLQAAPRVDYRRGMAVRRAVLEHCAQTCFAEESGRLSALRRWVAENPATRDYARFRATLEKRGTAWTDWPERMQNGLLEEGDGDPAAERYHLYVQWLTSRQLGSVSLRARENGQMLYLDLPLGVHPAGYDAWRERAAFVPGISTGAPPDAFFAEGQDWEFPPLHPERIREQGYRYYIACLRNHLRYAGLLRLDHVAGLHRLFWVPAGLPASEGVYVRYNAKEFYAVLCLESQRHQAVIVGEDLGIVPGYVRRAMARHRIYRMYVLPFELSGTPGETLRPIRSQSLATLNTHDMAPFASFWLDEKKKGAGVALPLFLARRGHLAVATNRVTSVLQACLAHLAASRAGILLVNLEDLWLERAPQNVPGTTDQHPNWQRKARYGLEKIRGLPGVAPVLRKISRLRNARQIWGMRRAQREGVKK